MKILVLSLSVAAFSTSVFAQAQGFSAASTSSIGLKANSTQGFNVTPKYSFGKTSSLLEPLKCNPEQNLDIGSWGMYSLAMDNNKIANILSCTTAKDNPSFSFSQRSCENVVACLPIEIKKENSGMAHTILSEAMAYDFARNSLEQNVDSMERMEVMRAFARKKFDDKKLGNKCLPKFRPDPRENAKCNYHMLEAAFKDLQENCKVGSGCYNKDENEIDSYKSFVEKQKAPSSAFVLDYPNYRVQARVDREELKEAAYLSKLAELATNPTFIKLNQDQKAEKVLEAMGSDIYGRVKDPILAYDFSQGSPDKAMLKKSKKFQEMMSVFTKKKLTEASFIDDFDKYRKKRVDAVFGSESTCKDEMIIPSLCSEMTNFSEGKTVPKSAAKADSLSSKFKITQRDLGRLSDLLGKELTLKDAEALLNAKRCISYELYHPGLESSEYRGTTASNDPLPSVDDYAKARSSSMYNLFGQVPGSVVSVTDYADSKSIAPREMDLREHAGDGSLADNFAKAITGDNISHVDNSSPVVNNDAYNNSYYNSLIHKDEETDKKDKQTQAQIEESYINPNAGAAMDGKIADLENRLNEANKKLTQIKTASDEAEIQKENQKKIDAENEKIKDLRAQLDSLKKAQQSQAKPETSVAKNTNQSTEAYMRPVSASSIGSSSSLTSAPSSRQEIAAPKTSGGEIRDNKDRSDSSSSSAIASGAATKSAASNITLTGTNSVEARTITAVDGMSAEKVSQTISSRIIELKGIPFFIEEGGMVKEIIPVLKDGVVQLDEKGNPLYEKIVKGKATDKKFAKIKESGRAPAAAITSTADLKRDQEEKLKRERAEYIKLKDLTNGVLKKK